MKSIHIRELKPGAVDVGEPAGKEKKYAEEEEEEEELDDEEI